MPLRHPAIGRDPVSGFKHYVPAWRQFGHRHFQPVIEAIIKLAEKAAKEPRDLVTADNAKLEKEILGLVEKDLGAAYSIAAKQDRQNAVAAAHACVGFCGLFWQ